MDKIRSRNEEFDDPDAATERAHEILQIVGERVEKVRPSRSYFCICSCIADTQWNYDYWNLDSPI